MLITALICSTGGLRVLQLSPWTSAACLQWKQQQVSLFAIQEVAAIVGAILDSSGTLALEARAACRLDRGDVEGAVDDLMALQVMGLDVQQVKRHTADMQHSLLFTLLFLISLGQSI